MVKTLSLENALSDSFLDDIRAEILKEGLVSYLSKVLTNSPYFEDLFELWRGLVVFGKVSTLKSMLYLFMLSQRMFVHYLSRKMLCSC